MPTISANAGPQFTLVRTSTPTTHYIFRPCGDTVMVIQVTHRSRGAYTLPAEEARKLWKRLLAQGFERF